MPFSEAIGNRRKFSENVSVALSPRETEGWLVLAEATKRNEKWERSLQCLQQVPPANPRILPELLQTGDQLIDVGRNIDLAEQAFLRVLLYDPYNARAFQRLTFLYSMTLQRTKLQSLLRLAMSRDCEPPESYFYLLAAPNLRFSNGLVETLGWAEASPAYAPVQSAKSIYIFNSRKTKATSLFASLRLQNRDPQVLIDSLERHPDNFELLATLIDEYFEAGDLDKAKLLLARLPANEQDSRFWRLKARELDQDDESERAIEFYQKGLEHNPLDWTTRNLLAASQRSLGLTKDAAVNADLAFRGKELENRFQQEVTGSKVAPPLLIALKEYASLCGDHQLAQNIP